MLIMLADLQEENERAAAGEIRQAAQRPWRALPPDILRTTSELNKSTSLLFLFRPPPQSHRTITKLIFCIKKGIERAINSNNLMIKTDNKYKRCFYIRKKQQPKSHRSLLLTEYSLHFFKYGHKSADVC